MYLKDETLYKILWAFFKGNAMTINKKSLEWEAVKEIIAKKSKDIDPRVMADILVLATREEQDQSAAADGNIGNDLFSMTEAETILKMKVMNLDDLINLMWSA